MKKKTVDKIALKVLYLEDSPRDVEIIRELLIDAGYDLSMDCTEKKKEFTSLLHHNKYDIILSDFKLPGFNAIGALKLAIDICPDVPFICVSGSIGEEIAIELIKQGAVDYVLKDRLVRLPLAIKRALDESKERKAHRHAEEALRESEERFRLLFDSSIDAVLLTSPSGDIFSANPAACKMFQRTEEELCSIGRKGIIDASDPRLAIALKERTRTGRFIGELTLLRKDGSKFSAEMSSVIFKGKKGNNHTSMIIRDITERKRAEEELQESEKKYKAIFDGASEGILIADGKNKKFKYANPMICSMLGYSTDELVGLSVNDIHPPEHLQEVIAVFESMASGEITISHSIPCLHKDGSVFFAQINTANVIIDGIPCNVGFFTDVTERKQMEESLRKSEARLRAVLDATPFPIALVDVQDNNISYWSRSALTLFGHTSPTATEWYQIAYPDPDYRQEVIDRWKHFLEKAQQSGQTVNTGEYRVTCHDGSVRICELYATFLSDKLIVTFNDITARKRAEEVLKRNEERLRITLEATKIGIWEWDLKNNLMYASPTMYSMLGCKPDEKVKDQDIWLDRIHPEDRRMVEDKTKSAFTSQTENYEYTARMKHADGSYRWINVQGYVMDEDASGNATRISGIRVDVTERKRAEEKLQESVKLFQGLFNASPDAIVLIDPYNPNTAWPIVDCNEEACRMNGYTREELVGHSIDMLNTAVRTPEECITHLENIKQKSILHKETTHRHKDGHIFPIETSTSIVTLGGREMVLGIDRDITERKRAEGALRERELQISLIYDTVGDVIYNLKVEKEGNYIFTSVNRCFLTATGLQANQIIGKRVQDVVPEPSLTLVLDKYAEAIRKKEIVRWEETTEYPTGLVTGEVSIAPVFDDQGHCTYLAGTVHDITERKRMEEALVKEQFLMNMLMDNVPDGIYFKDKESHFIRINKSQAVRFGLSDPAEVVGKTDFDFFAQQHAQLAFKDEQEIMRTGQPLIGLEEKETWPDGSETWVTTTKMLLRNKEGEIIGTFGISKDITERKQAEEMLRKNEEKLKELFEEAPVGYHETDELGNISAVNQTELKMLGFTTSEEMIGFPVWEFIVDDEESRKRTLGKLAGNLPPDKNSEQFVVRRDGTSFPVLIDDIILRNEQGKIAGIRTTLSDITERKRSEEALRETRDYLENLLSFANTPIIVWDPNFKITRFNVAIEKLTGYTLQEVIGKHLEILLPIENRESSLSLIAPTSEGDHLIKVEIPILCKSGNVRNVIWSSANIYAADGHTLVSTIAQGQDITEQKKLQQELFQAQKMESIGTLAGGIAHDFNNILGIILGYSSLMEKGTLSPGKFNESLGIIKKAVGRGTALVKQILTFARKTDVVFEPISIYDLIHELLSMLRQTFPKVISFIEIIDKDIPLINADRTQIHQVLLNLCVNARDAMPNGGTITIKAEKQTKTQVQERIPAADQDSYICINVTDTGMGMDEATRRQIFDPFFTTKEKGKGTGLGLAVVYGVIQSHHGFIDFESELGRGTTFWLYFPIPPASEQSADVSLLTESFATGGTETVLLVEDEEVLLEVVRLLLESKGYKVHTTKDGNEAINIYKLHRQEINLVITDMGLPGITGMEVFKKLREIDSDVNVIVASGFFEPDVRSGLAAHGAKGFIQKPYTPDEVLKIIREVLDAKKD